MVLLLFRWSSALPSTDPGSCSRSHATKTRGPQVLSEIISTYEYMYLYVFFFRDEDPVLTKNRIRVSVPQTKGDF